MKHLVITALLVMCSLCLGDEPSVTPADHLPCELRDRYPHVARPTIPDGWTVSVFAAAPDIFSPASMAVSPTGDVYVGQDPYNTGGGHEPGLATVILCVDSDGDGQADTFKTFADNLNSPQGMCFVGDTLYVAHAPYLTAFRDTDRDGVADQRRDLITGLGPIPVDLVHHIPSGLRMGVDGWLYISIGDKGIEEAVGVDGRKVRLLGGGVVRIRPDGTMMELYAEGTRNTYDVSVSPLLDIFVRDNTNDGGGWNSRIMHIQRDGSYGYPSLFINFADEIIPAIADYGGGSATGSIYIQEPTLPPPYNDGLYTIDWVKGTLYRHDLHPRGATFDLTEEQVIKALTPTDVDVDAYGRIFLCDWARRSWNASDPLGVIYLVQPPHEEPKPLYREMASLSDIALIDELRSMSLVRRTNAQCELLARYRQRPHSFLRGPSQVLLIMLHRLTDEREPLPIRVSGVFTLKQLFGTDSHPFLHQLTRDDQLREFALRALGDRDDHLDNINIDMLLTALRDENPRVREQAVITLTRFAPPEHHAAIVPLASDEDVMVRHAAMRGLRRLNAFDACIAALRDDADPAHVRGALLAMREMHDLRVIEALHAYIQRTEATSRQQAIQTIARLYRQEGPWDGRWWGTLPDTRGPYYNPVAWEHSSQIAAALMDAARDADAAIAQAALEQIGRCGVSEAAPVLAEVALKNLDAARALVKLRSDDPAALRTLESIAVGDAFEADLRSEAIGALVRVEGQAGLEALARVAKALHNIPKPPQNVLDPLVSSIASRSTDENAVPLLIDLVDNRQQRIRTAAATVLLRSDDPAALEVTEQWWTSGSPKQYEAMLLAIPQLPRDRMAERAEQIRPMLASTRTGIRTAAMNALAHLEDVESIPQLMKLAEKGSDRPHALLALAKLGPQRMNDQQIFPIAQQLSAAAADAAAGESGRSTQLLAAAEKFAADARIDDVQRNELLAAIRMGGVLHDFLIAGPIKAPGSNSFAAACPPEDSPTGPFEPFECDGNTYEWRKLTIPAANGVHSLELGDSSFAYLTTTYHSAAEGSAVISVASDDGIKLWVNGELVHANDVSRSINSPADHVAVHLHQGSNVLMLKVNNNQGPSGVAARVRHRVAEFEPQEMHAFLKSRGGDISRGGELFTTLGCNNCHTVDPTEPRKGPFLGDAGSKFDRTHLVDSILRPAANIAQGFATQKIVATDDASHDIEHVGFITRETPDELELRDTTGRVTIIPVSKITRRVTLDGSTMPSGLLDDSTPTDLVALVAYLESLKTESAPTAGGN